eukprot:1870141-Pyramimonas_sp.AAC.1
MKGGSSGGSEEGGRRAPRSLTRCIGTSSGASAQAQKAHTDRDLSILFLDDSDVEEERMRSRHLASCTIRRILGQE